MWIELSDTCIVNCVNKVIFFLKSKGLILFCSSDECLIMQKLKKTPCLEVSDF